MENHMPVHSAPCAQYKIWRIISAKIHKGILKDDFQAYEVGCKLSGWLRIPCGRHLLSTLNQTPKPKPLSPPPQTV